MCSRHICTNITAFDKLLLLNVLASEMEFGRVTTEWTPAGLSKVVSNSRLRRSVLDPDSTIPPDSYLLMLNSQWYLNYFTDLLDKIQSIFANLARLTFDLLTKSFPRRKLVNVSTKCLIQLSNTKKEKRNAVNLIILTGTIIGMNIKWKSLLPNFRVDIKVDL